MKIIFHKKVLLESLVPVMGTVSTKNTITTIEGVLVETLGGTTVRFSTYDMNKGMRVTFEALEVIEEGSYIINAQRFLQIVKVLSDEEVTLEIDDRFICSISCGTANFSMHAMKGEDFPALPELSGRRGFEINAQLFKNKINKVVHSVAELDNRPMLCGVFFKIEGQRIEFVACDGFTLSLCDAVCDIKDVGDDRFSGLSFILPGHAIGELTKIIGDSNASLTVMLARKHAIIKLDRMIFFTRMIDSDYIDYYKIMPKDQPITVRLNRERLLGGLERANLIADEKSQGASRSLVTVAIRDDYLSLSSTSVNGKVYDQIPCTHEGEDLELGFNCRFLINSVRAAEGDEVLLTFKSANQAMTIEPAEKKENESFFYLVLPRRMSN